MRDLPLDFGTAIAAAAALVALLLVVAPRRWLPAVMILWLFLPAFAFLGIGGWEILTRPGEPDTLGNLAFGFLLVASVVALPWTALSAIGFAIGLALRAILRPERPADRAPG